MVVAVAVSWLMAPVSLGAAASPPEQPATGPGGRDYRFAMVERARVGTAPRGAFVFTPVTDEAAGEERELGALPLVIFLHGFVAVDPELYAGWIEHLVRRGAVVVYPDYQPANPLVGTQDAYLADMMAGVRAALRHLDRPPEENSRATAPVAVVGHSLGGILAVNYAALAGDAGFPAPDVLMAVTPGGCATCGNSGGFGVPLPASPSFPEGLRSTVVVASDDTVVGEGDARWIWWLLGESPGSLSAYVRVMSDRHGTPPLIADHLLPQTGGRATLDALDWNGLWRLLDLQLACVGARSSAGCDGVFGPGEVAGMGHWSDGVPVRPLEIVQRPSRSWDDVRMRRIGGSDGHGSRSDSLVA